MDVEPHTATEVKVLDKIQQCLVRGAKDPPRGLMASCIPRLHLHAIKYISRRLPYHVVSSHRQLSPNVDVHLAQGRVEYRGWRAAREG